MCSSDLVRDPSNNLISGTLVTQPPNGLIFLLPPVDLIFPQGRGLAPEGTYTVKVNLVDKVGNQGVETFFFVVDNTDIDANSIQVALFPVSDENADFTPDTPNPSLTNPIGGLEIPDNPDLVDLGTLTAINTINRFTVCSTDQTFDLTRTANFVKFKARLNGPDTVARTLNASGTAVLDSENLCQSVGSIAFNVSNDQKQAFPNLGLFPNPSSGPGANVEPGTRDPRFGQFDGPYLVELEALDDAGNRSTPINKEFLLDTTQPYTDDTFPKNNSKINSPLRHISAILVDPHPPRVHTFDETGYVNFGSGISVERSSLKLTLRSPYRQEVLGRSDLFLADGTLRGKLNYTHIPNSIDPTKPSYNPKDDAYRALLEIVDRNTKVIELPSNGDADGLYEIESVPVDNAGNSVDAAIAGQSGWQILPPEQRRERPKEVTKTFVFLLDSIAPSLEIDRPNTNSNLLTVSGRDFKLTGKTRDLSAQQEATRGGAGIDRVEYEIVLQTLDGELVPPVEASLNGPAKQNPILKGQLADLEPLIDTSKNPHTSSTRPMDPRSYANLELEERIWKIDGKLPPQNEVISQSDNQTGKQANYFLKIHSYDLAGNVAKESLQLVLQFGKLPSPVIVAPDFNESLTKGIVKFEWKPVSNAVEYELSISHPTGEITTDSIGSNGQSNLAFNKVLSKEGEYSWFVRSKDSVGNFGDPTISRKFVIDRTPPSINILSWLDPSPEAKGKLTIGQFRLQIQFSEEISAYPEVSFRPFNSSIPPQIIVTDKVAGQYWEGIATIPETATAKWDGLATIKVKSAIDKAGNQMIENRNFKFEIDTGPSYDVKFFENPVFQTEVVFVIRSSENLAGPPVLFNAQSVQVVGQNLVKVGDATFTAILKITGSTSVEEGSIEITGTDLLGNSSTRKVAFPLQAARQDGSATLQNSRLKIHLPDGALEPGQMVGIFPRSELLMDDEDMAQMSRARIQNARGMRKIRSLESLYPWSLKLSSPGSLEILVDEVLGKGEGIFLETEDGLVFLGAGSEKNLPISRFGSLAVYQDSSSPVLEPENEEDLLSLDSIRPVIRFRVFDEGSGLRENSFRGEINGTLFEFRALEGDLIEARIPGSLPRGSHEINLEVQDRVGNLTRYSSHAVVAGPIRIQAVSFPNPARSSATIQYDLNRQAETIHLKIFDSNDGLVFQSNSEDDLELAISGRKNRYLWNLETNFGSPVSNGVYYCQLQAMDAQGRVDRAVIKIAVVR